MCVSVQGDYTCVFSVWRECMCVFWSPLERVPGPCPSALTCALGAGPVETQGCPPRSKLQAQPWSSYVKSGEGEASGQQSRLRVSP